MPDHARQESQGDEYRHRGQRGRDHRRADLLGGGDHRHGAGAALLDVPVDVLQHHDAVVHDPAHGDGQAGQAHEVQRPVEQGHDQHRYHHAEGDGQRDDDGGPDGVGDAGKRPRPQLQQEEEYCSHSEEKPLKTLPENFAQFFFQTRGLAFDHRDFQVRRKLVVQVRH